MNFAQIPFSLPPLNDSGIHCRDHSTIHRAKWIVVDPWTIIENGYLQIASGIIIDVGAGAPPSGVPCKDHGPIALMPTCTNAHTHLELSALKDSVPVDQGFRFWVKELIEKRDALSVDSLRAGVDFGIEALINGGCRLLGDISTLGLTLEPLQKKTIAGIGFREYLGDLDNFSSDFQKSTDYLKSGLAVHAPHTTSPELLKKIKRHAQKTNALISIHVAESEDEFTFITTGSGPWADFLTQRHIDFSHWPLSTESPVRYLSDLGILDDKTLAVHLIITDQKDIELLRQHRTRVCLCPRSNNTLHERLPNIEMLLSAGFKPCLGTDSLASAASLSIFDEMSFVASKFQNIPPETILAMGTVNGADALGFSDRFGTLHPGHVASVLAMPVICHHKRNLIETIIRFKEVEI